MPRVLAIVSLVFTLLIGFVEAGAAEAHPESQKPGSDPVERASDDEDVTWGSDAGPRVTLFPAGDVFPVYVADPHRPTNALLFTYYADTEIPGTQPRRTRLSAGGRFGMVRFGTGGAHARSVQVSLECGLTGLFDSDASDDVIGWDGHYGLTVTTASNGPWSFKFALLHTSAHIGDEYEERMNRTRLDYTREEAAAGAAWTPTRRWRVYGELAHSYYRSVPQEEPWRAQQGVEFEGPRRLLGAKFAWYAAANLDEMQERAWRIDRAVQTGLVANSRGRAYRLALEYYKGRPFSSEFTALTETSVSFGLRIDM